MSFSNSKGLEIVKDKELFMKQLLILFLLIPTRLIFAQGEEIGPMISNPSLYSPAKNKNNNRPQKTNAGTFDSTFIYVSDTLSLPFFDEFSTNKFQQYNALYSDPGVTFIKKFHLLDNSTETPIPSSQKYSSLPTYRRIYSADNLTYMESVLPTIPIKKGSLASYPVTYVTTNVYPSYYIYDSLGVSGDVSDTVYISSPDIFQDSATQFFTTLDDPNALWLDDHAYHNYRFGLNPPSLGVVTFDGLDRNGKAYALGSSLTDYADYLTSKPIDLSVANSADSLYLTFLYQAGGLGEQPEPSDSLILEFYSKDLNQWNRIWSDSGSVNSEFRIAHINIISAQYFKKGFQFRFKNYGNLTGGFDHFHLDYVHLRTPAFHHDSLFEDFAWVYPIGSLLKEYTAVPWDHYKNNFSNKMADNVNLVIHNGKTTLANNSNPGKVTISYNGLEEGTFAITGNSLSNGDFDYAPRTTYSSVHDFSTGYHFDETKTGTKQTFDILGTVSSGFTNYNQNDSTFSRQYFGNYYSYDDGSAEAAYGTTGTQSNLAIQYTPYESDSLLGIMTNFVESATDVSNKLFLLTIWDDNNGVPGSILYQDDIFFPRTPLYSNELNQFHTYFFHNDQKVKVDGTFYVGWKQFDAERLNIGFDKNNINSSKNFYSLDGGASWTASQIPGTVMIRPLFSTEMNAELGFKENREESDKIILFPNPTSGLITVLGTSGVAVFDVQGQKIMETKDPVIDLSGSPAGLYFLQPLGKQTKIYKVIKY
jgi:hypothetical protein